VERFIASFRSLDINAKVGEAKKPSDAGVLQAFISSGVKFSASSSAFEEVYYNAVAKLLDCIKPNREDEPILQEGGIYMGCWLESTGTINAEICARFIPSVAELTYGQFARYQREDGLIPYKITADGPVFKQIQLVTPPARSVWNHYKVNGADKDFLRTMYKALSSYDDWLSRNRNTRGTGCVEAFCAFDTGHDLSPRFWHVPDTPHRDDPAAFNPNSPFVPFLAPDLTASVYCSRKYLAYMAEELGEKETDWFSKAKETNDRLMAHCFDADDLFFYDVDRSGQFVRIQTDVLLRVLACEVGDDQFFSTMLKRYLLNTSKFFAKYPLTSVAMDDPRFDPFSSYNTWAGATNFLTLIRTPHAFEYHQRHVELTWIMGPILTAMSRMKRFGQCLSPWTGEEGFTETYSPAILCMLDFVERMCGIMPVDDDQLWFTGLLPYPQDHGIQLAEYTGYSRTVDGRHFELFNEMDSCSIYRDGQLLYRFPSGIRLITDRSGEPLSLVGMSLGDVEGTLEYGDASIPFKAAGNETLEIANGIFRSKSKPGIIYPSY